MRKYNFPVVFKVSIFEYKEEKGRDLTQSYSNRNVKRESDSTQTPPKRSITRPLLADLGRSLGVTTATQLVWLTGYGPTVPLPARAV